MPNEVTLQVGFSTNLSDLPTNQALASRNGLEADFQLSVLVVRLPRLPVIQDFGWSIHISELSILAA